MAADWQREMRANWESRPQEAIRDVEQRYNLKKGPNMNIPKDLLEHKNGLAVYINPDGGKEIALDFNWVAEGLERRGRDLTEDEADAIRMFIMADAVSPRFVRRVVEEYRAESINAAFLLKDDMPDYWLEYLLRRYKGHFYRKRYPFLSVV